ncbi:MAG: hypothetical protein M3P42_02210 [Actinomycetota bacterium]|nr:hypothetical protein [Actinomycetota bacterium]
MQAQELVELALRGLAPMQLASGVFCRELVAGHSEPQGASLRYTLMVDLGLAKAEEHGYSHGLDSSGIRAALDAGLEDPGLVPGDFGLYLWRDAIRGERRAENLAERLERSIAGHGGLEEREGMELAWIVQGLALQLSSGSATGEQRFRDTLELLLANQASSGLLAHAAAGRRRRFPNFASQIYGVLALSTVAALGLDGRALDAARRAGDAILRLQLPDGGWPWLYDVERGGVVERYEIYSVHQHAMAPMGLLRLAEASGLDEYAAAAAKGVPWIYGLNELRLDLVDRDRDLVYRSIRRVRPWSRAALYLNTASALALGRPLLGRGRFVSVNATCRPYELGWLLEAWCGREHVLN